MRRKPLGTRRIVCLLTLMLLPFAAQAQNQCYTPRENQDGIDTAKWAFQRGKMLEAEKVIHANAAFRSAPVPVRTRSTLSITRLHVRAYPEKSLVGIDVWTGECNVIPQAERIDASIGVVSVFFNHDVRDTFLQWSEVPKLTGQVAGFPEYNGAWVVMTKDGRLPWIPQTLADRLDREGTRRERALAEWRDKTDKEGASRLRTRSNELALQARELRKAHQERSVDPVLYAMSEFELYHIKPGDAADAIGFKPDPTFPDPNKPNQVQLITVSVSKGKERNGGYQWMARTKETLDWKGIAALLD